MKDNLKSIIEKIQKLQKLATSSNPNEAAAAAAKANDLIDKYRLEEADISVDSPESDPMQCDTDPIYVSGRITQWKVSLIQVLAMHYGVSNFNNIDLSSGRKVSNYKLCGRKSDIAIVRYMFGWLANECQRLSDLYARGNGKVYCASYQNGFVSGISEQLKKSREQIKLTADSSAMVKLDSRYTESYNFMMENNNLRVVRSKSAGQTDANGFSAGRTKGESIPLNKGLNGSSSGIKMLN